ncbi:hypothetical protein [Actinoplanes sp. NPDC026619]|uniref:hypothetical protein n=1 Tax=Actinoplanes sp. NPDC026619 TaxID=3155798 RepID=UPI0033D2DE3B
MTRRFGDRGTFGVEAGEIISNAQRVVHLWLGDHLLTADDHTVYLPSFLHYLRLDVERVRRREIEPCPFPGRSPEQIFRLLKADQTGFRERFWFMQWDAAVDNVLMYAYLDVDLVIVFEFWRNTHPLPEDRHKAFVARVPPADFVATTESAAALLDAEYVR